MNSQATRDPLQAARSKLSGRNLSVIFPEGTDARIIQAAQQLHTEFPGIRPLLVGNIAEIEDRARSVHTSLEGIERLDPANASNEQGMVDAYLSSRPGSAAGVARRIIRKPLYFGGLMTRMGIAQAMVAGITVPTARVIEAALMTIGLEEGISTPSSFFLMLFPGHFGTLLFADCAINIDPDVHELAAIGVASARSFELVTGETSRTAFLSFSTHGSAQHPRASKVRDAATLAKTLAPGMSFDGELQADAALIESIAKAKVKHESTVAGHANVLIFPDLASANISYKLVQHLGGATALGPFLQGFARPISDLSRGASIQDVIDTTILTLSRSVPA